jgi:ribonuclease HII
VPDFSREIAIGGIVAGIDEAGRGPWAGPVVAAAVVLDRDKLPADIAGALDDSKKLKPAVRREVLAAMAPYAAVGVGAASAAEIDRINVLQATFLAMRRAVIALSVAPDLALVDGNRAPSLPCPAETMVQGDGRSLSIAAASIVAKVTRDRIMASLGIRYPGFGWERNAGYGTAEHIAAMERLGPTPHHRKSYAPVLKILSRD